MPTLPTRASLKYHYHFQHESRLPFAEDPLFTAPSDLIWKGEKKEKKGRNAARLPLTQSMHLSLCHSDTL